LSQPYLNLIHQTLPRLLALFDTDTSRCTYGMGDRYHWAWGLIDFGNGTFQGAAHGLARLMTAKLLPHAMSDASILKRIDAQFIGAATLCRSDGSLEEAFPYEGSYCVTALVAYDLLSAVELLEGHILDEKRDEWIVTVRPMIGFLCRSQETHAIISNHLATALAALVKWQLLSGESVEPEEKKVLDIILKQQSDEGWFNEYGGADPGYQSLCTYYLADVYRMRPDLDLIEPLRRSVQYLWHFAHPDGSFGGLYGSRNTRFYYPAGFEFLAAEIPEAAALARSMRSAIKNNQVVTLASMDEPNLVPMFNAYCWAAAIEQVTVETPALPFESGRFLKHWPESGIIIESGARHYTVISTHKGGVCYHFAEGEPVMINAGVIAKDTRGDLYSNQTYQTDNTVKLSDDNIEIESRMCSMTRRRSTPMQLLVLRMLNLSIMRNTWFREKVKQLLVRLLISGGKKSGKLYRTIEFGEVVKIYDQLETPDLAKIKNQGEFVAIHMASQGYWQVQDDRKV